MIFNTLVEILMVFFHEKSIFQYLQFRCLL